MKILVFALLCSALVALGREPSFCDFNRTPRRISVLTESGALELASTDNAEGRGGGVLGTALSKRDGLRVVLFAPDVAVKHIEIRWQAALPSGWKYLGDAWERAYGDLEWKPLDAQRVMPWYFLATEGFLTHGYGVRTGPSALCHWTVDTGGITLHADVRCGGVGVQLGKRKHPIYGFNDWYCSYGHDTAEEFLKNTAYVVSLSPKGGNRPFAVVDDGWQIPKDTAGTNRPGPWFRTNPKFSATLAMPEFVRRVRALGARPGVWFRPFQASPDQPQSWRLARDLHVLDPSVPEVRAYVRRTTRRLRGWGFELIKHDYSTEEITGRWGFDMHDQMISYGWAFADRTRTTAEIVRQLYSDIRRGAGNDTVVIGCNTIGHLAAGIFELQRIGDDTSGQEWARTRKMGVNCLAFRAPQQGTFFDVDADCAGQTGADSVHWLKNRQWLDLLGHSGTPLFVSFPSESVSPQQADAIRAALAAASQPQPLAEPLDWLQTRTPAHWRLDGQDVSFSW